MTLNLFEFYGKINALVERVLSNHQKEIIMLEVYHPQERRERLYILHSAKLINSSCAVEAEQGALLSHPEKISSLENPTLYEETHPQWVQILHAYSGNSIITRLTSDLNYSPTLREQREFKQALEKAFHQLTLQQEPFKLPPKPSLQLTSSP